MQTQEIDDYEKLTKDLPLFNDNWKPSPEDIKNYTKIL